MLDRHDFFQKGRQPRAREPSGSTTGPLVYEWLWDFSQYNTKPTGKCIVENFIPRLLRTIMKYHCYFPYFFMFVLFYPLHPQPTGWLETNPNESFAMEHNHHQQTSLSFVDYQRLTRIWIYHIYMCIYIYIIML